MSPQRKRANLRGRVAKLTEDQETKKKITIEDAHFKTAATFEVPAATDIRLGDFVAVSGTAIGNFDKSGCMTAEHSYMHEPLDGSARSEWLFFFLENASAVLCWPPEVEEAFDVFNPAEEDSDVRFGWNVCNQPNRADVVRVVGQLRTLLDRLSREPWLPKDSPTIGVPDLSGL